jgi:primase-polymerase (primpol)-like protein
MIGEATGVIAPIFENIPKVLTKRRQWVTWRLEERDGRLTKIPLHAGERAQGERERPHDLDHLRTRRRGLRAP